MPLYNPVPSASASAAGLVTLPAASAVFAPSNPATTTSQTEVMMGLGVQATAVVYTPTSSGKVLAVVTGVVVAPTAAVGVTVGARYGTLAGPATTVAAGSNGGEISQVASWSAPSAGVLAVASTAGWATSGTLWVAASGSTVAQVTYTGVSGNTFTGCAYVAGSATGTLTTGGAVTGAPQNGAPVVGTALGPASDEQERVANVSTTVGSGFPVVGRLVVTPSTPSWVDVCLASGTSNDAVGADYLTVFLAELLG